MKINSQRTHRLGISGSIILSDPSKFNDLFKYNLQHIEIGEFPDEPSFQYFLSLLKDTNTSFALHSPLYRNQSKYDLLEKVHYAPEYAWDQFESEVAYMSQLGAEYVLVHFPYFKEEIRDLNVNIIIEDGLKKLSQLQNKYSIPIICEPKLGLNASNVGINYLDQFPVEKWSRYGLKLCIDIGDYLLASGEQVLGYIEKWRDHISVVHLHNVEIHNERHVWIPVHPSHEDDGLHYNIKELLLFLASCNGVFFVIEHTPHTNPSQEFIAESIQWVKDIIGT